MLLNNRMNSCAVAVLGKSIWGAGPSSFGRQQQLSEITIEPIKNWGVGKIWGPVPPWPQHNRHCSCGALWEFPHFRTDVFLGESLTYFWWRHSKLGQIFGFRISAYLHKRTSQGAADPLQLRKPIIFRAEASSKNEKMYLLNEKNRIHSV